MSVDQLHALEQILNDITELRSTMKETFRGLSHKENLTSFVSQNLFSMSNIVEEINEKCSKEEIQELIKEKNNQNK
jgi:hypothetical protein